MRSHVSTLFYNICFIPALAVSVVLINSVMLISAFMGKCLAFSFSHKGKTHQKFLYVNDTDNSLSWEDVQNIDRNAVGMISAHLKKLNNSVKPDKFEVDDNSNHSIPNP